MTRRTGVVTLVVAATGLTAVHAFARPSPATSGILVVLEHLFSLGVVCGFLAVCLLLGLAILRAIRLDGAPPLDRLVFGVGLGIGVLGSLNLCLGLARLLHPTSIAVITIACVVLARRDIPEVPATLRALARDMARFHPSRPLRTMLIGISAVCVLALVALSLTPQVDWDTLLLHLRVPSQFLAERRVYVPPDNLPSGFAGVIHMAYVTVLAAGGPVAPAVLSASLALLLALTVVAIARFAFDDDVAALSLIGLWGSSIVLMVAVTPRVDVTLACFALLAQYALLRALPRRGEGAARGGSRSPYLLLAAILTGLVCAVKYQGIVYAAAMVPLAVAASADAGATLGERTRSSLRFGIVAAAVGFPWMAKNLILFHAPFAPMFMGAVVPPWLQALYGSASFPVDGPATFSGVVWKLSEPFNLRDFFLAPGRLTVEDEALFYYSTPLLAALPLAVPFVRGRMAAWLAGTGMGYAAILLLYSPRTNLRYLIPAIVVLTIVSAAGVLAALRRWFPDHRARRLLLGGLCVPLAVLPAIVTVAFWGTRSRAAAHLVGVASAREYAFSHPFESVLPRVAEEVARRVPEGGRLLLLFEPRGYPFGHSALEDSQMNNWPLIALAPVDLGCLEGSGITHVLVNRNTLDYRLERGFEPGDFEWQRFPAFRNRCLRQSYEFEGYTLYELRNGRDRSRSSPD